MISDCNSNFIFGILMSKTDCKSIKNNKLSDLNKSENKS